MKKYSAFVVLNILKPLIRHDKDSTKFNKLKKEVSSSSTTKIDDYRKYLFMT